MANVKVDRHHVRLDPNVVAVDEMTADDAVDINSISITPFLVARYGLMLSSDDAAKVIGCSASHVRALCATGVIPGIKIGQRWRIPTVKFASFLDGEAM